MAFLLLHNYTDFITLSGIIIEIYSINDLGLIYLDSFFF